MQQGSGVLTRPSLPMAQSASAPTADTNGVWDRLDAYLYGGEDGKGGLSAFADVYNAADAIGRQPLDVYRQRVPGGKPVVPPGMFGMHQLINAANQRGWGGR